MALSASIATAAALAPATAAVAGTSFGYFTHDIGVNFGNKKRYSDDAVAHLMSDAWEGGVACVISITNNLHELPRNEALAARHDHLYFTVGVHPHSAGGVTQGVLEAAITRAAALPKCVAIGECGLDYDRMFSPQDEQLRVFRWQVALAKALDKPLYLHCRSKTGRSEAFHDMIGILDAAGYSRGVVHCFTGPPEQAAAFVERGLFLGVTGWLCDARRNADLVRSIAWAPLERLLVETDAPWMPVSRDLRASVPTHTRLVVEEIARVRGVADVAAVGRALYKNAHTALGLPML